ncbi:MAG TPA: hypothetical protein VHZ95_14210 [Polyangiales bacterium]|nr:hypothetical protein [Polyangiales bacterium]
MSHDDLPPMSLSRFRDLLDAYGGELARWPLAERSKAEALAASDPRATELQREALALDAQLDAFEIEAPSPHLRARVLEIPIRHAPLPARVRMFGWRLAALALVPCVLGFLSGALTTDNGDQDEGWNDLNSIAMVGDVSDEDWP